MIDTLPSLSASFSQAPGAMLAAILDQSLDCIKVIGVDGTLEYMNRNGQCAMEIDDVCAVTGTDWISMWPAEAQVVLSGALDDARGGTSARFEAFCPTAKGSPRWWDVSVAPLRGEDGAVEGFISTSRDITDRVQARDAERAMGDELRHRLRNQYAVVGGLLAAHSRDAPAQQPFVRDMLGRLTALAAAQTLEATEGSRTPLTELLQTLLPPYATPDCAIDVAAGPDIGLEAGQVDALALVMGELAVNSTKHGALNAGGRIAIDAEVAGDSLSIAWSERSHRAVGAHERSGGQGLRLMSRVLAARKGTIAIAWRDDGLDVRIELPVVQALAEAA